MDPEQIEALKSEIIEAVKTVYDPEIPVNIYDLGLIYNIEITGNGNVTVQMTLTSPNCPEAQSLPASVETTIRCIPSVVDIKVELIWEPPWTKDRIAEEARLVMGIF